MAAVAAIGEAKRGGKYMTQIPSTGHVFAASFCFPRVARS
jgi:hypothetical protein